MSKTKPAFSYILAIGSILGFLTTAILSFFNYDFTNYSTSILFLLLGGGLLIEGEARRILKMVRGGLTSSEISHITASVIGLLAVITGIINIIATYFSLSSLMFSPTFSVLKGIISVICMIIIAIEAFIVK